MRRRPLLLSLLAAYFLSVGCGQASSAKREGADTPVAVQPAGARAATEKKLTPGAEAHENDPKKDPSGKDIDGPAFTLKVHVPDDDWRVLVNEVPYRGDGKERTIKVPALKKGHYVVTAVLIPNNYTWRYRTRHVSAQGAEADVDLTKEDPKHKDHIEVRYVPTPDDMIDAMCKMAKVGPSDVVYDLGCGDARIIVYAMKKYHAKRGVGIDIDPERVKEAKENVANNGLADKIEIRQGDVLKIKDLHEANVVMLYMGDDINLRLRPILKKTLRPGSRVVSHRFTMGDWKPDATKQLSPDPVYSVHLWRIRAQKSGTHKEGAKEQPGEKKGEAGEGQSGTLAPPAAGYTGLLTGKDGPSASPQAAPKQ